MSNKITHALIIEKASQRAQVVLRDFSSQDSDDLLQWATDDEVTKHLLAG